MFEDAKNGDIVDYDGKRWRVTVVSEGSRITGSSGKRKDMPRQIALTEVKSETMDLPVILDAIKQAFRDTLVRVDVLVTNEDGDCGHDRQEGWLVDDLPMDAADRLVASLEQRGLKLVER